MRSTIKIERERERERDSKILSSIISRCMEALSTFLSSSNVITGFNTSALNNHNKTHSCCLVMKMKGMKMDSSTINSSSSSTSSTCPLNQNQAAAAATATGVFDHKKEKKKDSVSAEEMDRLIRESIGEIVKNIRGTPVFVEIFSQGPSSIPQLRTTEASPENWPLIKNKWNQTNSIPNGIMLIEQLNHSNGGDDDDESDIKNQTWGLAVQGRGLDCAPFCYILNTCRVRSSSGFCTHFCLIRAKCSGESLGRQIDKAWLH